ncbi:MAG: IS110 family transposase [Verrucomicrobia bacterium]|nr:IS110 family transposase [Verrucomicrobiota bacterium]
MNTTYGRKATSQDRREQVSVNPIAPCIKLGLDVHADNVRVVRQVDGATPQPAQKFTLPQFLRWVTRQRSQAAAVYSCYEAGPFGYGLHRQLTALGVQNLVVRPQKWDELGKGVKTDRTDALALVQRLDRYVRGNLQAFAVVRVPTPEEEAARWVSRQREQLRRERQRLEAQGRSLLLTQSRRVTGRWWLAAAWEALAPTLSPALREVLEVTAKLVRAVHEQVELLTAKLESAAAASRPRAVGALTSELLRREVCDWKRFTNRRQVASYTGMCPSVYASGQRMVMGAITKHGNARVRWALIEMAWRLVRYQPHYPPVAKWRGLLQDRRAPRGQKKRLIVAIARHLAIDLWRLATGRCDAAQLQLLSTN